MDRDYYIKKLNELFAKQEIDEKNLDYSHFDTHIAFLKQLAIVEFTQENYLFLIAD